MIITIDVEKKNLISDLFLNRNLPFVHIKTFNEKY